MQAGTRGAVGIGAAAVLAGATMVAATFVEIVAHEHGLDAAYAAWWVALLALSVPVLHLPRDGGQGARALGWLGLAPVVGLCTEVGLSFEQTAPWWFECGTGDIGFACLPFGVVPLVGAIGAAALAFRRAAPAMFARLSTLACGLAIAYVTCLLAVVSAQPAAPSAHDLLVQNVHTLAAIPPFATLDGPIELAGSRITRACEDGGSCRIEVDGIAAETLTESDEPLELGEGLGYRFLRHTGSEPSSWLAFVPGEPYGRQLRASDLGAPVAAPHGLGAALALCASLALLYVLLALARVPTLLRLRRAIPAHVVAAGALSVGTVILACDPAIAIGPAVFFGRADDVSTYRVRAPARGRVLAGDRAALAAREWTRIGEHGALALTLLVLGGIPVVLALRAGAVVVW